MRYLKAAALLVICLASSAYGGNGDAPADGPGALLSVFDAQGRYVGPLVSFEDRGIATVITVNGAIVVVPISRASVGVHYSASKFAWGSSGTLVEYPAATCSGPPTISTAAGGVGAGDTAPVRASVTIREGAETKVYVAPDTYSTTIVSQSQASTPLTPSSCSPSLGLSETGWLPETAYSLNGNYPEPLTIRMDEGHGHP
jgi:hypothetical protein